MNRVIALTAAVLCAAVPAFAGDKPVISVKPPYFEYFDGVGPIRYYTRGNLGTTSVDGPVAVASSAGSAAAAPAVHGQNRVGAATLTRVQSDALYARLLTEAKSRKLR